MIKLEDVQAEGRIGMFIEIPLWLFRIILCIPMMIGVYFIFRGQKNKRKKIK